MIIKHNIELEALKITRRKLSYRLLNVHITLRRVFYGMYHEKTNQLVRKRNLIDYSTIEQVRNLTKYYNTLRDEVKSRNHKK